eukprot:CAMPEP_0203894454 /NCGR_PEP_ID=MMETSP0359-20131031/37420_1 /ASSEMBLY_ACC=CAM_ASM_000338 /TAXON_ID=268821 /ORGANISM="Scrippsiella Hangoei, Strain SHTV-5" /LENGTH=240 /DNA_ID=CAMNT_0050816755 /DNA_START=29 /DNA_END=747 /DNA_ORIENTATION=+
MSICQAVARHDFLHETLRPPSRNEYPGSERASTPRRWKHFWLREDEHAEAESVLQRHKELLTDWELRPGPLVPHPKKSLFSPISPENIPEAPALDKANPLHGVLLLGRAQSGKTTLVRSLIALVTGRYPSSKEGPRAPLDGLDHSHELPNACKNGRIMLILTDSPPLDAGPGPEAVVVVRTAAAPTAAAETAPTVAALAPTEAAPTVAAPTQTALTAAVPTAAPPTAAAPMAGGPAAAGS